MRGQNQIERNPNMRSYSMADLPAALVHVRTPGVILLARDVKKLVSVIVAVATRRGGLPMKPQQPKAG